MKNQTKSKSTRSTDNQSVPPSTISHQPSTTPEGLLTRSDEQLVPGQTEPAPAAATRPWRGVFCDGPQSDQDAEGEEIPTWSVYVGDEDGHPTSKVYRVHSYTCALQLAQAMARDRRLNGPFGTNLINEATHA
jgi:hypothetical protein